MIIPLYWLLIAWGVTATSNLGALPGGSASGPNANLLEARQAFDAGRFADAAAAWNEAATQARATSDTKGEADALINLSAAQQMLGAYDRAAESLYLALRVPEASQDPERQIRALNALANLRTLKPEAGRWSFKVRADEAGPPGAAGASRITRFNDDPEALLNAALDLATSSGNARAEASTLNNLGNLYSSRRLFAEAVDRYQRSAALCEQLGLRAARARTLVNAAVAAATASSAEGPPGSEQYRHTPDLRGLEFLIARPDVSSGEEQQRRAKELRTQGLKCNDSAYELIKAAPPSFEQVFLLVTIAQNDQVFAHAPGAIDDALPQRTVPALEQAITAAEALHDARSLSCACGFLGRLYEVRGDPARAATLTARALFAAQQAQSREYLYRWQWQSGRLLAAESRKQELASHTALAEQRRADAIGLHRAAVDTLQFIRNDIASSTGNQRNRLSFREDIGPLYFELADLLLQRADRERDAVAVTRLLGEARDTVEMLKTAELEDYFQHGCIRLIRQKLQAVDAVASRAETAVFYPIALPDRIELLVNFPSGLKRLRSPDGVGALELAQKVQQFRGDLVYFATDDYRRAGKDLYDWLIRPAEPQLQAEHVHTLVFVPDASLRTIPMGALYDGQRHLVERYAIAITPGLTLMEPRHIPRQGVDVLLNGLSVATDVNGKRFPALPYVPVELANVHRVFGGGTTLLDQQFVPQNLQSELARRDYSIIHIASHAYFGGDAQETYLVAYNTAMGLDGVERLIRPAQLRDRPVELLTLSACQTAAGDDRASLGLAGIAIKAGARSALATLWCVNDEATAVVISDFYQQLKSGPTVSKAKALQEAQRRMIHHDNPGLRHPYFWAPYLIIGNWL